MLGIKARKMLTVIFAYNLWFGIRDLFLFWIDYEHLKFHALVDSYTLSLHVTIAINKMNSYLDNFFGSGDLQISL